MEGIPDRSANEKFTRLMKLGIYQELYRREMLTDTQFTELLNRIK